jgi:hypothetical protein
MRSSVLAMDGPKAKSHDPNTLRPTPRLSRLSKWGLIILVITSVIMISKPQVKDWGDALISFSKQPSVNNVAGIFFTTITLLYSMTLGGYAAWAFLTYTRIQPSRDADLGVNSGS